MDTDQARATHLPTRGNLAPAYVLSLIIAILTATASAIGLLSRATIYPTENLIEGFVANDVVTLALGLPILLGSMWLAGRGRLIGLLFWPGALLYGLYNSIAYVFGLPLNVVFVLHLALVALSTYATIGLVAAIDAEAVKERLAGAVPERGAGGILAGLGLLFCLLAGGTVVGALVEGTPISEATLAVHVADLLIVPAWVIGGMLLWRCRPMGYVAGLGLLFQGSMLFVGLIVVLLLQPVLVEGTLALSDVVAVAIMGLICFIPFGLFVRGVALARRS